MKAVQQAKCYVLLESSLANIYIWLQCLLRKQVFGVCYISDSLVLLILIAPKNLLLSWSSSHASNSERFLVGTPQSHSQEQQRPRS